MGCLIFILLICGLFFLGITFNAISENASDPGILVGFAISAAFFYGIYLIIKKGSKEKDDFYTFCGGKEKLKYEYNNNGLGIAIDSNTQTLFLKKGKALKKYAYTDVRDWSTGSDNVTVGANTGFTREVQSRRDYLVIHIKDVDYPEWKFVVDSSTSSRWFEILNQEVNKD